MPNKTKLKFDQDFKACWSLCFEREVLNDSKYSIPWVCCAFYNVFLCGWLWNWAVLFYVRRKGSKQCSLVHPLFSISFNLSKPTLTFRTVRQISTKPAECTSRQISTKPTQCILFCNYTSWSELPKSLNLVIKVVVEGELLTYFNRIMNEW